MPPSNESTPTKKCLKKITLEEEGSYEALDACEKRKESFGTRAQLDYIKGSNLWCHLRVSLKELFLLRSADRVFSRGWSTCAVLQKKILVATSLLY